MEFAQKLGVVILDKLQSMSTIEVICGLAVTIVATKFIQFLNRPRLLNVPSVKGGLPYLGQVLDMVKGSPWDTMTKWAGEYGGIYTFHLFGSDAICISDCDLLKEVLHAQMPLFKKDTAWTYKPFLVILGNGLVTAHGKDWRRQRILLSNHLRIEILEEIPEMTRKAVGRLADRLDKVAEEGRTVEMAEEFRTLTLQVISEALLSISAEESDKTFAKMYLPIVEEGNLRTWDPSRMYLPSPAMFKNWMAVKRLNDYVSSLIRKRWDLRMTEKASNDDSRKKDVLDKVLSAISPEDWGAGVVRQIRDEIKTFVLAGHETSASMLAWTLYELHSDGEEEPSAIKRKVLEEARRVYGGVSSQYTNSKGHVMKMPPRLSLQGQEGLHYTECCLRESLRKYSVVPTVVRLASEKTTLAEGKYVIPKGATVMVNMQGVHHNPANWPEPLVYRPERFEGDIKPYTFVPFVEGPRNCLGQFLSLLESKCVITMLLCKFNFVLQNPHNAGEKHDYMVPIIPKNGHIYTVHKL